MDGWGPEKEQENINAFFNYKNEDPRLSQNRGSVVVE
jgi:hypothetical protein